MESYQTARATGGEGSSATFRLSKEEMERLVGPEEPPPRTLWEWVRYGTSGPPPATAAATAVLTASSALLATASATVSEDDTAAAAPSEQHREPPPPQQPAAAPQHDGSVAIGVVTPTTGRIRNVEGYTVLPAGLALSVQSMSLYTPDGSRQLFANVSVDVPRGEVGAPLPPHLTLSPLRLCRLLPPHLSLSPLRLCPPRLPLLCTEALLATLARPRGGGGPATPQHLLIMGNSGTGKSSMLRALAGLWDRGDGSVARPRVANTMFLPQR